MNNKAEQILAVLGDTWMSRDDIAKAMGQKSLYPNDKQRLVVQCRLVSKWV